MGATGAEAEVGVVGGRRRSFRAPPPAPGPGDKSKIPYSLCRIYAAPPDRRLDLAACPLGIKTSPLHSLRFDFGAELAAHRPHPSFLPDGGLPLPEFNKEQK